MSSHHSYITTFRSWFGYLCLGAAGIFAALLSIEVALRLVGYGSVAYLGYGPLQNNLQVPELGYAGRPDVDGIQTQEGYSQLVLNDRGFHDVNHRQEKDTGSFRVAVLGNSHTMATQVEISETYVSKLGRALGACPALQNTRVETLNFGIAGYTTSQNYLLLKEFVWRYSPDLIVLQDSPAIPQFEINEGEISARVTVDDKGRVNVDSSFLNSTTYKMRSSSSFTWFLKISDHSRALQYFNEFRRKLARARSNRYSAASNSSPTNDHWEQKARLLRAISGIVRSHSTPLVVLLIPDGEAIDPRNESGPTRSNDERWWDRQGSELGIPIINPTTNAWSFARQNRLFLSGFGKQSGVGHLTRYGNDFFGQELADGICGLLSQSRPS
jgi:hypothetical protein